VSAVRRQFFNNESEFRIGDKLALR
jgi:hypothetical protein